MQAVRCQVQLTQASQAKTQRVAGPAAVLPRLAKAAGAGLAALTLAAGAHAATVRRWGVGPTGRSGGMRRLQASWRPIAAPGRPRQAPMGRWQRRQGAGLARASTQGSILPSL